MQVTKLRVPTDENGLVPSGEYFKRLAAALREANEREAQKQVDMKTPARARSAKVGTGFASEGARFL